jgi:LPXTG-motif cell wall-anchored protein
MKKRLRIAVIAGAVVATGTFGFVAIPALAEETPTAPYNVVLKEAHQGRYANEFETDCAEVGNIGTDHDGWVFNVAPDEFDTVVGAWAKFDTGDEVITTYLTDADADAYPNGFANATNKHLAWVVVPFGWELITAEAKVIQDDKGKQDPKMVVTHTCPGEAPPPPSPSPSPSRPVSPSPSPSVEVTPSPSLSPSPEASPSSSPSPSASPSPSVEVSPSVSPSIETPPTTPTPENSPSPSPSKSVSPSPSASVSPSTSPSASASTSPSASPSSTPPVVVSPSGDTLPLTGTAVTTITLAGVALVGLGVAVLMMARRRRKFDIGEA